jgi:HJR/Mrr/RecB family endonuclease
VESLPDFEWYESVDSFLIELSKLYVSTLASVKMTYNNQYPGQTLISDQDLEQIVTQALREKCKIIAKNQMKYFSEKGESAVNRIKTKHDEVINKYTDKFIDKYSIEI